MTLQTMRYIIEVANCRSFSQAARSLYVTQSALSAAVKDAEDELGIQIFQRSNRGVSLTPTGADCLKYCKEIIERSDYFHSLYQKQNDLPMYFSVSTQHLPFAVRAFNELLEDFPAAAYNVAIRETSTSDMLHDVSTGKSELGIGAFPTDQMNLLKKTFYTQDICFTNLAHLHTYVFLRKQHPLADKDSLSLDELKNYPFVTYDQKNEPDYYSEETLFFKPFPRSIHVQDRATKMAVIRSSDAFSIGVDLPNFNQDIYFRSRSTELIAVPFAEQKEAVNVCYLMKNNHRLSYIGQKYLELLTKHIQMLSLPGTG